MTNKSQFIISVDFNNQNEEACQLFALFLHSIERDQPRVYDEIVSKITDEIKKNDILIPVVEFIFEYKKTLGYSDKPVIKPSNVFRFKQ